MKSKYFKIVGVIEIVIVFTGLLYFIISMAKMAEPTFLDLLITGVIAFFAPAFGLALYTLGNLIETNEKELYELKKELNKIKDNIQQKVIRSANNQITHSNTNQVTDSNTNQVTHLWRCEECGTMISDYICPVCGKNYKKNN